MNTHTVTVTQTEPSGYNKTFTLDVLAGSEDLALERVYGWYSRVHEYMENGNDEAIILHPRTPLEGGSE